jgi:hypothetical protein
MKRRPPIVPPLALALLLAGTGCAAYRQLAVLRTVTFAFAGVSDVRLAGVTIDENSSFSRLGVADVARLGAAVAAGELPLELVAHVRASNPPANQVAAQLLGLDWVLFVENRRMVAGSLTRAVSIAPGTAADVPLGVRLDLFALEGGGARDLYESALAIAGRGPVTKDLRLELRPTIETELGPIRFTAPVVVRREAAKP